MQTHILSIILFTPLLGALILLFVPKENKDAVRWIANFFALAGFLISIPLVPMFWDKRFEPGFKFIEGTRQQLDSLDRRGVYARASTAFRFC